MSNNNKLKTKKMNRLKTTPKNQYSNDLTDQQIKDTLLSFALLIVGFVALFFIICKLTQF